MKQINQLQDIKAMRVAKKLQESQRETYEETKRKAEEETKWILVNFYIKISTISICFIVLNFPILIEIYIKNGQF